MSCPHHPQGRVCIRLYGGGTCELIHNWVTATGEFLLAGLYDTRQLLQMLKGDH